jgi:hypothetical protein
MNFLLSILLDISASADDSPYLTVARKPLEALIADWMRQGEEIHRLRRLVTEQTRLPSTEPSCSLRPNSMKRTEK